MSWNQSFWSASFPESWRFDAVLMIASFVPMVQRKVSWCTRECCELDVAQLICFLVRCNLLLSSQREKDLVTGYYCRKFHLDTWVPSHVLSAKIPMWLLSCKSLSCYLQHLWPSRGNNTMPPPLTIALILMWILTFLSVSLYSTAFGSGIVCHWFNNDYVVQ